MIRFLLLFWALTQVQGMASGQGNAPTLLLSGPQEGWADAPREFSDSSEVAAYLTDWIARQRAKAYWEASIDSLYAVSEDTLIAIAHRGPAYGWAELRSPTGAQRLDWARKAGYRERRFSSGRPLDPELWTSLRDTLVVRAADDGYPFASAGLDSIRWVAPGQLSARISVTPGPRVLVGEIRVADGARVKPEFLARYLGLRPGEPYNQKRVKRMGNSLRQLPYVNVQGPPTISFLDSLAYFDLKLARKPASRFDFVIGILPGSGPDERLLITGELNGELYNGLGQGERIAARFEQLRPQTQELAVAIDYPFLLNLPFGFEGELDLYRRDTSFLNLNWRLAANYLREGNDKLSVFWENRRTIVPGGAPEGGLSGALPDTLGVSRSFFGLQARRNRTDRRFSPRSGYAADLSVAAGFRRLLDVVETDSLAIRSTQLKIEGSFDAYFDPFPGTVIYFGLKGAGLLTAQEVLPNEQYRIGGARLLRGFDEQSVFARDYLIATAEFRLLLGGNAFLYTFIDAGRVNARNKARPDITIDYPLGFGAGVNFETRAGVFGLSLALGRSNGIKLDLGAPKVHLGYVSVF